MEKSTVTFGLLQTSSSANDAKTMFYQHVITSFTGSEAEKVFLKNVNQEIVK